MKKPDRKPAVYLRALELGDLKLVHKWHNCEDLYEHLGGTFHYVSESAEQLWLQERCSFKQNEVSLAVCDSISSKHVGNIYLRSIDWVARTAVLHIFIGDAENRGKGYGHEAAGLLLKHAFHNYNLNRIELEVLASNRQAVRLYEKCGFIKEGVLRKRVFKKGLYQDVIIMALLREDFDRQQPPGSQP